MSVSYVANVNLHDLMEALYMLVPECSNCLGRKLHFCIERCCIGAEPICFNCE